MCLARKANKISPGHGVAAHLIRVVFAQRSVGAQLSCVRRVALEQENGGRVTHRRHTIEQDRESCRHRDVAGSYVLT